MCVCICVLMILFAQSVVMTHCTIIYSEPALVQSQYLHLLQPLDMVPQQLNNGYYNPNCDIYMCNNTAANNNDLTKIDENLLDMDANKDHVVRYVQQQQQHQQQLHHDQYGYQNTYHHYMSAGGQLDTSPDSGISNDPCLSPKSLALVSGQNNQFHSKCVRCRLVRWLLDLCLCLALNRLIAFSFLF